MAVVFPYVKNTTWADGSGGATPITAAKLNLIEDGAFNAHQQPAARVYHNTTQSILNNTATVLAFNTERFDVAGGAASTQHDTVTNNSRLTCRYAGKYQITANIDWAGSPSSGQLLLRLNGATLIAKSAFGGVDSRTMVITTLYDLAVNDYVEVQVFQSSGVALLVNSTANVSPEFMWARVA